MKDPKERKFFYALFGGKMLGVSLCLVVMYGLTCYFGSISKAQAQETPAAAQVTPAAPAAATPATAAPAAAATDAAAPAGIFR